MEINLEKGTVSLYGKNTKLDTLIKRFTQLSGEQVFHFLSNRGIMIPRKINCMALVSVLNKKIKFLHSNSLSKDYFTRLQFYPYFTEQQYFNLFKKIANDPDSFLEYRYNLFKLILINYVGLNLNDGEITYLKNVKKSSMETFEVYFNFITGGCLEQDDSFDGVDMKTLEEYLPQDASNQEIIDIAGKYGITIPQRLKKDEYLQYIFHYQRENNMYTDEMAEELNAMTLNQISTYARRVGVPINANMSKKDMVLYLFYFLSQCEIDVTTVKRIETPSEYLPLEFTVDLDAVSTFGNDASKKVIHYEGDENDAETFEKILIDENIDEQLDNDLNGENTGEEQALVSEQENPEAEAAEPEQEQEPEEVYELADLDSLIASDEEIEEYRKQAQEEQAQEEVVYVDEDGNPIDPAELENQEQVQEEQTEQADESEQAPVVIHAGDNEFDNTLLAGDEDLADAPDLTDEEINQMVAEANKVEEEKKTIEGDFQSCPANEAWGTEKMRNIAGNSMAVGLIASFSVIALIILAVVLLLMLM